MSTYYFVPSRNVFGEGSVVETGELMKSLGGSKAMIVTDEFLASHPMTARIQKILKDAGVDSAVFGKAEPNPKDTNVVEGGEVLSRQRLRLHPLPGRRLLPRLRQGHWPGGHQRRQDLRL